MADPRATLAARNNADWCDVVCRTHGIATRFEADLWRSLRRSPPLYPDAVTLRETATPDRLLDRIDSSPGCSIKDSFCSLDLSTAGMRVLFEADWLCRPALPPDHTRRLAWHVVRTAEQLQTWAAAHGGGEAFQPALLAEPDVTIVAAHQDDAIVCGAVANRSAGAVGISNVFAPAHVWPELIDIVAAHYPGLPMVGYEHGDSLAAALAAGFRSVGRLRVWLRD